MTSPAGESNGTVGSRLPHVRDMVAVVAGVMTAAAVIIGVGQYVITSLDSRFQTMDSRFQTMDSRFQAMDHRMQAMEGRLRGDIAVVRGDVADVRKEVGDVRKEVARLDARLVRVETIVSEIRNRPSSEPG